MCEQTFGKKLPHFPESTRLPRNTQKPSQQAKTEQTQKALTEVEKRQNSLLETIEYGTLSPSDETIRTRMQKLKAERETLLIELASIKRQQSVPFDKIAPKQVEKFRHALRKRLFSKPAFGKQYLQLCVSEIRVGQESAEMKGSYTLLANSVAEMKTGTLSVPTFIRNWRPHGDSNPGYRRERAVS